MPETSIIETNYQDFIKNVVAADEVWGLEGQDGLAISSSSEDEEQDVIPFWSSESLAESVAVDDWVGFKPSPMGLTEFLENWLVGMHNDEILVGTNWDAALSGKEIEPMQIALDLAIEVKSAAKSLEFAHYKNLDDFIEQVKEASGL